MALFIKTATPNTTQTLTSEQAQIIYGRFEEGLDETQQFIKHNTPTAHSKQVIVEIKRLEQEVNLIMNGNKVKTPAVYSKQDEE